MNLRCCAELPAGNFQRDKPFCMPTSSTENRAAKDKVLGLFERGGSLKC